MKKKIYQYKRTWLLLLVVSYILLGFFYVPKIINQQLTAQLAAQLNMQATMSEVHFNPLTFNTEIKDLKITDAKQQTWFDSQLTGINFDPLNLLWGEWKFSDLNLVQPHITLMVNTEGQMLVPAIPELPSTTDNNEPINLTIDQIHLNQGSMNLQAGNIKKDFSLNIKSIELTHEKFSMTDEDTRFEIKVTTENDESVALKGDYNHAQQSLISSIQLSNWQITTLNQILPDDLGIHNQAGQIQASGGIDWQLSKNPLLTFSSIDIQGLQSHYPKQNAAQSDVLIEQLHAQVQQVTVDTEAQTVIIERIESESGNWQINWPFSTPTDIEPTTEEPKTAAAPVAEQASDVPAWQVTFNQIDIQNWPIEFIDRELNASLPLTIDSLELLNVNNLNQNFSLKSQINLAGGDSLNVSSEQLLSPLTVDATVKLTQLSLEKLAPWITVQSGLVVTQGLLSSEQTLKLQDGHFNAAGSLTIKNAQIENQKAQPIVNWSEIQVGATTVSSQKQTIVIDQITLDQANGNIIIDAEQNINIQNLNTTESEAHAETSPEDNTETTEWTIKIGAINIKDTSTSLIDQSIQPTVETSLSELNGEIKGLSSDNLSKADVSIQGKFNQFSPLSIQGQINPLSSKAYTDIKIAINDLDLLAFSPYAATYVAFPINGGKLDIELEYTLNQDELRGENNLLFKQFKLGDKSPAPDAIDLPLKLAVTLLSDMNGEMDINLPVSGNLTDPEFSYGGLVGKAIFKLITNIVASPFKILGALIPNPDPNLSDIQFASGSAELLPSEQNKLNQIAEIMAKKDDLNLQLNPHIDATFDQAGLQLVALLEKAPFAQFDATDTTVTDWLKVQLSPEELATYQLEDGQFDYPKIWQALLERQVIDDQTLAALTEQRNLAIKNHLIEQAQIAAEKIFIEQAQSTDTDSSMIKIGVSR